MASAQDIILQVIRLPCIAAAMLARADIYHNRVSLGICFSGGGKRRKSSQSKFGDYRCADQCVLPFVGQDKTFLSRIQVQSRTKSLHWLGKVTTSSLYAQVPYLFMDH